VQLGKGNIIKDSSSADFVIVGTNDRGSYQKKHWIGMNLLG